MFAFKTMKKDNFNNLIPELPKWNDGNGIDIVTWIGCVGNFEHAIKYSSLFWPEFTEHAGCILWADFKIDAYDGFMRQTGGNKKAVEAVMNHVHILDLFADIELCQTKIQENEVLKSVYKIATEPKRWSSAHDKFSDVRQLLLSADADEEPIDSLYEAVLEIAEKVCKVTYNASGEPAPFDYDSGYKLVCSLRRMVNLIGDSEFEKLAWYVVSCEKYS
jgi:hypothetical protein